MELLSLTQRKDPETWRTEFYAMQKARTSAEAALVEVVVLSDIHLGTYGSRAEELLAYLRSIEPLTAIRTVTSSTCGSSGVRTSPRAI